MTINSSKSTNDVFEQLVGVHVHGPFERGGEQFGTTHQHAGRYTTCIRNGVTCKQHRPLGTLPNLKFLVVEFVVDLFAKRFDSLNGGVHAGGKVEPHDSEPQ